MNEQINNYIDTLLHELKKSYPKIDNYLSIEQINKIKSYYSNINEDINIIKAQIDDMVLNEISNFLNFNIKERASKNKYFSWNDDKLVYSISKKINENIINQDVLLKDDLTLADEYTVDKCKDLVYQYFKDLNPTDDHFVTQVKNILDNDIEIKFGNGRSVTTTNNITLYFNSNFKDLITMAHEVSHRLTNGQVMDAMKEIDSIVTEDLFKDYLLKNKIECIKDKDSKRPLNITDIEKLNLISLNRAVNHAKRTIAEVDFKNLYEKTNNIDKDLLIKYSKQPSNIFEVIKDSSNIDRIIGHYCSHDPNFDYSQYTINNKFDPHTGEHLENERRFIYAHVFNEHFKKINTNGDYKKAYVEYLQHPSKYDLNNFSKLFNFKTDDINSMVTNFTDKYTKLSEKYIQPMGNNKEKENLQVLTQQQQPKKETKPFNKRNSIELKMYDLIKKKNEITRNQKKENKVSKIKIKTPSKPKGFVNVLNLILLAGIFTIIVILIIAMLKI